MDTDIHIAQLKTVELSLTEQISLLDSQYHSFTEKAKQAASNKNRIAALSALRSRKLSESALQRRSDALGRIQEVLHGVEQAASHAGIIKALEGGAKALENLNKEIGGIEKVEKVMDRIRDGLEETEDVGRIIAEIGNSKVDELEVQEEFDEMLKASEEEKRRQKEEEERIEVRRTEQPAVTQTEKTNLAEDMKNVSLDEQRTLEKGILEEPILS